MEAVASLEQVAAKVRPVTGAESRLMGVPAALGGLFPEGGVRKGSTATVEPISLALALAAPVTAGQGWVAAVGMPSLGAVAAAEMGVDLRRLAMVPAPGEQWPMVVAALMDGFDLLMVRPPVGRVRQGDARRLAARVRERGAVMLIVGGAWPEPPDLRLTAGRVEWEGLGAGYGHLSGRRMEVVVSGRRVGGRERRATVWLPGAGGGVEPVSPTTPGLAAPGLAGSGLAGSRLIGEVG